MSLLAAVRAKPQSDVLETLTSVCEEQGLAALSGHLADLGELVRWDMKDVEDALATLPTGERHVELAASHLIARGGKRLRPMCVAIAARVGSGFSPVVRELGVAVELVHCATLLHDDVVDLGDQRRGAPAARTVYGNAASIFAGDWLLVDALRRVRNTGLDDVIGRLLDIIEEMIFAESIQLERRGRLEPDRETYFRVVEGKTAALFRWAMLAGGRAGGLAPAQCEALERYGLHLGVAFQLVDDLLDYTGSAAALGKGPLADLREGKVTYPLIVALERQPSLRETLDEIAASPIDAGPPEGLRNVLRDALDETSALEDCQKLAQEHAARAIRCIADLPAGRGRTALETVALATVHREA